MAGDRAWPAGSGPQVYLAPLNTFVNLHRKGYRVLYDCVASKMPISSSTWHRDQKPGNLDHANAVSHAQEHQGSQLYAEQKKDLKDYVL